MKARKRIISGIIYFMIIQIPVGFSAISLAETDVTDKVELIKSGMRYDRRTGTTSLEVSLKNISEDVLLTPITVVILFSCSRRWGRERAVTIAYATSARCGGSRDGTM